MPIVARQAGARTTAAVRLAGLAPIGAPTPPVDLLPSGTIGDHPRDAGPWGEPAFAREVDRVRSQLAPICSRPALAASFDREAGRRDRAASAACSGEPPREADRFDAVRAAYAVRWAELGDGRRRPPWSAFVTERD